MAKFTNPLDNVGVASPCSQDWNEMIGDERKRYCGDCKLNVYNLSGMSRTEAENLILNSEGRLCVRFYRRADGSVLTKDCPVGWQAIKRRVSRTTAAFASLFFGLLGGLGFATVFNQTKEIDIGRRFLPIFSPTPERYTMGNISAPTPTPTPKASPTPRLDVVGMLRIEPTPKAKKG
ncbi:MAG TPA: hypothetical protein VGC76_19240 [Pyrinomonadaceae bacterium]|jgi:hypothetical protein